MRVGIAQMETRAGAFEETLGRMADYARRARERDVDLLVFPMAALCGVSAVQRADREGFVLDLVERVAPLVEELPCPCLLPFVTAGDGAPIPEALLIEGGEARPVRLAARLEAGDASGGDVTPEDALPEIAFRGARLGVAFSYEDLDAYDDYDYGVDVIVFLSGYGFSSDDPSSALGAALLEGRFPADAEATGAWIVGVGSLGCYDTQVFCGSSFVLAPWGELAAQAPSLEEALLVCDVDPSAEGPLAEPLTPEVYDGALYTWGALTLGVSRLVEGLGGSGACLAVGERLADMLLVVLAVDAFGPTNVGVVVSREDLGGDAVPGLLRALRIPEGRVRAVDVPAGVGPEGAGDALQVALAGLARETGLVALGPRDKTGWALEGPAGTLSAARLEPFADLYRSEVVEIARMRAMISPVIPQGCLVSPKPPLELPDRSEGASDEAELEFTDVVLASRIEWERPVTDIVAERGRAEGALAVIDRLRELEVTRPPRPLAPTLSSRTLAEASAPVGLVWRDRVRERSERMRARLEEMLGDPGADDARDDTGERGGGVPPSADAEVRDILGHLRDFSLGGPFSSLARDRGSSEGDRRDARHLGRGPDRGSWEGPFSEN